MHDNNFIDNYPKSSLCIVCFRLIRGKVGIINQNKGRVCQQKSCRKYATFDISNFKITLTNKKHHHNISLGGRRVDASPWQNYLKVLATLGQGICRLLQPLSRHTCPFTKLSAHNLSFVKSPLLRLLTSTLHSRAFFESHSELEQPFRICFFRKEVTSKEILGSGCSATFVIVQEKPQTLYKENKVSCFPCLFSYLILILNVKKKTFVHMQLKIVIDWSRLNLLFIIYHSSWQCKGADKAAQESSPVALSHFRSRTFRQLWKMSFTSSSTASAAPSFLPAAPRVVNTLLFFYKQKKTNFKNI